MKLLLPATLALFATTAFAQDGAALKSPENLSLRNEVQTAIDRGLRWLESQQKPDGSWSNPDHPAITALTAVTFQREPSGKNLKNPPEHLKKAYEYIRTFAKPDGGIYAKGLSNYNTSVAMMALLSTGEPKDEPLIEAARKFIAGQQATNMAKPETNGGFGYGPTGSSPKRQHPDLDNTLISLEALRLYEKLRPSTELAGAKDLNWKAAADFVTRCQNLAATNSEPWVSEEQGNKGGFIYFPGSSNAGGFEPAPGKTAWRSYGTMTYAGMLSLLYADVKPDDARIQGALGWLKANYTLEENPGMQGQGLYYYYHLMTKGLAASGVDTLELPGGKKADWKREVAQKLLNLQKGDGFWVNDAGRWMESDPVLVTCYCVLALEQIYHRL